MEYKGLKNRKIEKSSPMFYLKFLIKNIYGFDMPE